MEQCGSAFGELRLRPPVPVSLRSGEAGPVFSQLLGAAQDPEPHIPLTPSLKVGFDAQSTFTFLLFAACLAVNTYAPGQALQTPCSRHAAVRRRRRPCACLGIIGKLAQHCLQGS